MDGDELRPLDVPVRLLGDQRQVDGVGKPGVEKIDRFLPGVGFEVVLGDDGVHGRLLSLGEG